MTAGARAGLRARVQPGRHHAGHRRRRRQRPAVGRGHPAGDRHADDRRPPAGLRARVQPGRHHAGHRRRRRPRPARWDVAFPAGPAGRRLRHRGSIPHPPAVGWLRWDPAVPAGLPRELAARPGRREALARLAIGWWSGRRSPGRGAGTRLRVEAARRAHPGRARGARRLLVIAAGTVAGLTATGPGSPARGRPAGRADATGASGPSAAARLNASRPGVGRLSPRPPSPQAAFAARRRPRPAPRPRRATGIRSGRRRPRTCRAGPAPSWPPSTTSAPARPGTSARASRRPRRAWSSSTSSRRCWPSAAGRRHRAVGQRPVAGRADDRGQRQRRRDQPVVRGRRGQPGSARSTPRPA